MGNAPEDLGFRQLVIKKLQGGTGAGPGGLGTAGDLFVFHI